MVPRSSAGNRTLALRSEKHSPWKNRSSDRSGSTPQPAPLDSSGLDDGGHVVTASSSVKMDCMATAIGFLTVRRHHEHGYFGGYLLVNALARPLEFYCTMPIRPSRAQTLLYGLTIDDFVCGEQIAKALIAKAKLQPQLILTDSPRCWRRWSAN